MSAAEMFKTFLKKYFYYYLFLKVLLKLLIELLPTHVMGTLNYLFKILK